ncbi:hypothetical protein ACVWYG_002368 [Pedobacter sp. UYEF25]
MFSNISLDVFIGLIFVFLLYSLMATILQEIIATRFAFRAKILEKAIIRMLEDGKTTKDIPYLDRIYGFLHIFNLMSLMRGKTVAPWFYAHPLIKYLAEDNWYSKPAYISSANFSKVILDLLKGLDLPASQSLQAIHHSIINGTIHKIEIAKPDMANPAIKALETVSDLNKKGTIAINESTASFLKSLWEDSGADVAVFQTKLEQWFDDTMERAQGWFKRYTRIVLFFIGFGLAYFGNVDTIAIKRILTKNKPAREQMVSMAIANYQKLDPSKIVGKDSSLLDSTYKLVAGDAEEANNILGLGKPWKDTLNMWEDSMKCPDFKNRLARLAQQLSTTNTDIFNVKKALSQSSSLLEAISSEKASLKISTNDSDQIASFSRLSNSSDSIRLSIQKNKKALEKISAPLLEYNRISFLKERSEYIKQKVGDKWFLYSPNQSGGWETFFGWIITALAIMLGAPFWFDLLSKLISLRGTGTKINAAQSSNQTPSSGDAASTTKNPSPNPNSELEAVG